MFFLRELPTREILESYRQRFPDMNVDSVAEGLHLLREASLLMRELESYFTRHDLSQLRFLILIVLHREPDRDGLKVSEIASRLDVSRPVMTRTLKSLEDDSLLKIDGANSDARAKVVRLTAIGRRKLMAVLPSYYRIVEEFMTKHREIVK